MAKQTILLVDHETDFLEWAQHQLESSTSRVLTETSADAGYKTFCMESPDLVLAEMNLHPFTGMELLARIRKHSPNAMVIIISAFGTTQSVIEAMKMGAFDFCRKEQLPFNIKVVVDAALKAASEPAPRALSSPSSPSSTIRTTSWESPTRCSRSSR